MNRLRASIRILVLACVVVSVIAAMAAPSAACECLDRLMPWNWCKAPAGSTTYAAPYNPCATPVAACPTPCAPQTQQVCSYVPQTCYRTVYQMTPVTSCVATAGCDPCTGCPVTVYRPVTNYVRSAQLVPYTTYRRVWTTVASPCVSSCSPCASGYSTVSSGCSSCGVSATSATTPIPEKPQTYQDNTTPAPSGTQTHESRKEIIHERPLEPIPVEGQKSSYQPGPSFNGPDRTTARPIQQTAYRPVVSRVSYPAPSAPVNNGGWVADRD
ncbi:MAG: hypothetical protein JW818_13130 [Pirellulales bacterium]|nr:hypothetical protein [Pirellulales bacterium]